MMQIINSHDHRYSFPSHTCSIWIFELDDFSLSFEKSFGIRHIPLFKKRMICTLINQDKWWVIFREIIPGSIFVIDIKVTPVDLNILFTWKDLKQHVEEYSFSWIWATIKYKCIHFSVVSNAKLIEYSLGEKCMTWVIYLFFEYL